MLPLSTIAPTFVAQDLAKKAQASYSHSKGSAIQTYRSVDPKEAQLIPNFFYEIGG
jgi:hypothetical protein